MKLRREQSDPIDRNAAKKALYGGLLSPYFNPIASDEICGPALDGGKPPNRLASECPNLVDVVFKRRVRVVPVVKQYPSTLPCQGDLDPSGFFRNAPHVESAYLPGPLLMVDRNYAVRNIAMLVGIVAQAPKLVLSRQRGEGPLDGDDIHRVSRGRACDPNIEWGDVYDRLARSFAGVLSEDIVTPPFVALEVA